MLRHAKQQWKSFGYDSSRHCWLQEQRRRRIKAFFICAAFRTEVIRLLESGFTGPRFFHIDMGQGYNAEFVEGLPPEDVNVVTTLVQQAGREPNRPHDEATVVGVAIRITCSDSKECDTNPTMEASLSKPEQLRREKIARHIREVKKLVDESPPVADGRLQHAVAEFQQEFGDVLQSALIQQNISAPEPTDDSKPLDEDQFKKVLAGLKKRHDKTRQPIANDLAAAIKRRFANVDDGYPDGRSNKDAMEDTDAAEQKWLLKSKIQREICDLLEEFGFAILHRQAKEPSKIVVNQGRTQYGYYALESRLTRRWSGYFHNIKEIIDDFTLVPDITRRDRGRKQHSRKHSEMPGL